MHYRSSRVKRHFALLWLAIACLFFSLVGAPPAMSQAYTGVFSWSSVAPIPLMRTEAQGGAVKGRLYVLGGFYDSQYRATTRADAYNPVTNTWSQIAPMPQALTHAASLVEGNTIWVIGGYVGNHPGPSTTRVLKYNTETNRWSDGPPLPEARGGGTAALVGRNIHFISGALRTGNNTNDVDKPEHYVLNLAGGTSWTRAANIPLARNHLGSATVNGRIYVIGGQFSSNEGISNQSRVDIYDPATNSWSRAADLPVARGHIEPSVLTINGQIYVFGGSSNDGAAGKASADAFVYDPQRNVWMRIPNLPAGRKSLVAGYIDGRLFVGPGGTGQPSAEVWSASLPDRWETLASAPIALGEVAGGISGDRLYLVGEGNGATLSYAFGSNTWSSNLAQRPFRGHHHAAEVINNQLYLFGGLGSGAGKVQIYNPTTNSWSAGADMPFAAGSSSSALIDGRVYVAGGIIGSSTTTQAAVYNPATNNWQAIAPMPQGRNHAAAATDGTRLYVFGGRGPGSGDGNTVANGFNTVQIYNPATNSWQSSDSPGSTLQPLPIGRGGMGKAVYAEGRFYVIGGETASGADATTNKVYNRVDVYNPTTNSWSQLATMPTARHGIFPLLIGKRIYVAAGGVKAAYSSSTVLEVFNLPTGTGSTTTPTATPQTATAPPQTATPPSGGATVRINTGGAAQTVNGVSWSACSSQNNCSGYVSGGFAYSEANDINTDIPAGMNNTIFTSEWTGGQGNGVPVGGTAFTFNVPVSNGGYLVRLHFAELNKFAAGLRLFDVLVENGQGSLANFDVFAAADGANRAIVREFPITVSDGAATISFIQRVENAKVSAIEIIPVAGPAPTSNNPPSETSTEASPPEEPLTALAPEALAGSNNVNSTAWPWDPQRIPLRAGGVRNANLEVRNPFVCVPT